MWLETYIVDISNSATSSSSNSLLFINRNEKVSTTPTRYSSARHKADGDRLVKTNAGFTLSNACTGHQTNSQRTQKTHKIERSSRQYKSPQQMNPISGHLEISYKRQKVD